MSIERLTRLARDAPLDEVARLARSLLSAQVGLVSLIDDTHEVFLGASGLPPSLREQLRPVPVEMSMCIHVTGSDRPLLVDDLAEDTRFAQHPARALLGVRSYAGAPIHAEDGTPLGAVCVGNVEARRWSVHDMQALTALARYVERELRRELAAAEAQGRAATLSSVLGALRNDLSGDLTMVLGGIETALHPDVPGHVRDRALDRARHDAQRVLSTLDVLLRTDRHGPLDRTPTTLGAVVDQALDATTTSQAGRLLVDVNDAPVVTDPQALARIVTNLLDNALAHTVDLVACSAGVEDGSVVISVHDCGRGPDASVLAALADGAGPGAGPDHRGALGLGLWTVRELVHRLGGTLEFALGTTGCTATVTVPARD